MLILLCIITLFQAAYQLFAFEMAMCNNFKPAASLYNHTTQHYDIVDVVC